MHSMQYAAVLGIHCSLMKREVLQGFLVKLTHRKQASDYKTHATSLLAHAFS